MISNFTIAPDDGLYIWNVLCFDENGASDWHDHNFTVLINATPDIIGPVSNNGPVDYGDVISFNGTCSNPGDNFRLFVCNSTATSCGVTTPGNLIICEGINNGSTKVSCDFTTNVTFGGTNTGTIAGCCDDGGLCDPATVSVDPWTIRAPPIISRPPSDNFSDIVSPTHAGNEINFSINATDPNNDATYKLLVCNTSVTPSGPATCDGGLVNQYCGAFANNEEIGHCMYSATEGLSGNYSWWAFVCDSNLCSAANNGTVGDRRASPFYINNNATMLNVTASAYVALFGQSITITSVTAADQENDQMRLQCGNESTGPFDAVCAGTYGFGERSCTFSFPYADTADHTFYCVLNDSHSISATNITIIAADNSLPTVVLNGPTNNSFIAENYVEFNYTPTDTSLDTCQLFGSWIPPFGLNQTDTNPTSGSLNNFAFINLSDGAYIWNVRCNDSVNNAAFAQHNFTFNLDTTPPGIDLVSPANLAVEETSNTISFEYEVNDAGANVTSCTLIINGTANESVTDPEEGNPNNEIVSTIPDGHYNWSINCTDFVGNTNQSLSRLITVAVANFPPATTLVAPENNGFVNYVDINLTYTVSDDKGLNNCTLYFDGVENQTDFSPIISGLNNFSINNTELGEHNWSVTCNDNAEQQSATSEFFFTVDLLTPETQLIAPANNSQFTESDRVPFQYNVTDNLAADMGNCSLFINDVLSEPVQTDVPINTTQTFLRTLENQRLYWYVSCADQAGNNHTSQTWNLTVNASLKIWNGSEPLADKVEGLYAVNTNGFANYFFPVYLNDTRNMTLDSSPPEINLSEPVNNTNTTVQNVTFSYNVSDTLTNVTSCELIIDNESVLVNTTINETGPNNFTYNVSFGQHTWSVNCTDFVGNVGSSDTFLLRVLFRELAIFTSNISVSNQFPVEGENVTVNATFTNIGDEDITDNFRVNITLYQDGGTTIILESVIYTGIDSEQNLTLSTSFLAPVGNNTLSVTLDTTDVILELNESNNEANTSIFVSLYHVFTGNISGEIYLSDIENESSFFWDPEEQFEANIFAVDTDSDISWFTLLALSRNLSNESRPDDFEELDTALNITNITGSINKTYAVINVTKNFTVFNVTIGDVPIVNSTNTSSFVTGILWDYSDPHEGQYNGSQDVLFVTTYNNSQLGQFGIYDYELKVPAALERYLDPSVFDSITFFTELR